MKSDYDSLYAGREDVIEIDAAEGPETIARKVVEKLQRNRARVSEVLESKGFPCPWALADEIISWFGGSNLHSFPASPESSCASGSWRIVGDDISPQSQSLGAVAW